MTPATSIDLRWFGPTGCLVCSFIAVKIHYEHFCLGIIHTNSGNAVSLEKSGLATLAHGHK